MEISSAERLLPNLLTDELPMPSYNQAENIGISPVRRLETESYSSKDYISERGSVDGASHEPDCAVHCYRAGQVDIIGHGDIAAAAVGDDLTRPTEFVKQAVSAIAAIVCYRWRYSPFT